MQRETIIEAMARAITQSDGENPEYIPWPGETPIWYSAMPAAQAALTALEVLGLAVVPREPTEAMLEAGDIGLANAGVDNSNTEDALWCWRAMLAAAPLPAAPAGLPVWQDIASAPRNYDDVLVFSPEHEGFNCEGVFSAFYDTENEGWFTFFVNDNMRLNPTHWMPLPAAPNQAASDNA